jgi:hypothetical protein
VVANPVSFSVDGKQRVAIAAGRTLIAFGLDWPDAPPWSDR